MGTKKLDKRIFGKIRNANLKYNLIENGDRVAVGVSGGKDSMALLYYLSLLKRYTPLDFDIIPIYLDLGWNNKLNSLEQFCRRLDLQLRIKTTHIGTIVFEVRNEKSPCSLCSNMRRGALNRTAKEANCNKVALGHHMDDVVNTLMMSILYEGRYHVFKPKTYLDRIDLHVIRPMIYVSENDIIQFMFENHLEPVKNLCPADGVTKRSEIKAMISKLKILYPDITEKFISSIESVDAGSFWF